MTEDQLFVLAAVFAARADSTRCKSLWIYFNGPDELFDIICSLWPELGDPCKLQFLFEPLPKTSQLRGCTSQDLLVELIETDNKLISMVEMDADTVSQRRHAIKDYAEEYMRQVPPYEKRKFATAEGSHIRKRLIVCNELSNELPMQYQNVWQTLMEDKELSMWINGIVKPLDHLNKRLKTGIKIKEFEKIDPLSVFHMILDTPNDNPDTILKIELMPYLYNGNYYELFLDSIINTKDFQLDTNYNFDILYHLLINFNLPNFEAKLYLERLQSQCALILFENGSNYLKIGSKARLNQILLKIEKKTRVGTLDVTVETLLYYSLLTDGVFKGYSIKELYAITKEDEATQEGCFALLAKRALDALTNEEVTLQEVALLLNRDKNPEEIIFSSLSEQKQLSILVEIILEKGYFSFLHKLIRNYEYQLGETVLVKYFWHFFNMASSGSRNNKCLSNAEKIVYLLVEENEAKYCHLRSLLDVAIDVSCYPVNVGKSRLSKPSYLLKFKEDPYGLISVLLESNEKLYQDVDATYKILQKLLVAFKLESQGNTDTERNFVRILNLHIDHALANMDFKFAYDNTKLLLQKNDINECWPTIFQVGKFIDPNWHDGEIPTEILFVQLEILGELLRICPVDQVEAITSQWSALELELATRDLIKDPFSLEKSSGLESLVGNRVSLNVVGNRIVNFLSRN